MKNKKMYYTIPVFILAVVIMGVLAIAPAKSLTMDVNPSIEIVTSRLDRVVEINPLNEDGKELLKDFEAENKNLENTVNELVDLMVLTGHIKGGEDNFVMITVEDDSMDSKYVDKVNNAIAAILENKEIEATVLNQGIGESLKGEKQTGTEYAAERLYKIDENISIDEIRDMTVRELVYYSKDKNIPIDNLFRVATGNVEKAKGLKTMISQKRAEEIALAKVNGEILKVELDDLDDDPEYEIEILGQGGKHKLEIDAYTGKINEYEKEDNEDKSSAKKLEEPKAEKSTKAKDSKISIEEAKKIALDLVGGGTITEFELDDDEYDMEIKKDGYEYEIEIDLYTGKVTEYEKEKDDDNKSSSNPGQNPTSSRISQDQAKKIALDLSGGGTITDFESDDDEYEIEIKKDGYEYEIEIDAYTGKVKEYEKEKDD